MNARVFVLLILLGLSLADTEENKALWQAAFDGVLPNVQKYLEKGADPNFFWATGNTDRCRRDDPNFQFSYGNQICGTSLFVAALRGKSTVINALLEGGADPDVTTPGFHDLNALVAATRNKFLFVVDLLLQGGADPNLPGDDFQNYPLHAAVAVKNKKIVELLLAAQASPDNPNADGDTAVHSAVRETTPIGVEMLKTLMEAGGCANIPNGVSGDTPLHVAAKLGSLQKVQILLAADGDPTFPNNDGSTPIDVLCESVNPNSKGCKDGAIKAALNKAAGGDQADIPEDIMDCDKLESPAEKLACAVRISEKGSKKGKKGQKKEKNKG